jgi:hypothetical protein
LQTLDVNLVVRQWTQSRRRVVIASGELCKSAELSEVC